jgi:nucleoside-diphosphate-sugar epimerase
MNQFTEFISKDFEISLQDIENKLNPLKNKIILITGGTGFIGSWLTHLIIYLNENLNYNIKLFLIAREQPNYLDITKYSFIEFIRRDVRNYFEIPQDVNYIIHAAASPDTRFHASQPLKTIETIVNGTTNVLQAATRIPDLLNIIHISSGLIYGKNETGIYQEDTSFGKLDCSQLNAIYSESKRLSETIAIGFKNQFRLPLTIIRPFTFIGAFQNLEKPWAFNSLLRDALLKQPLRILGNGEVKRGYMYGSDMAVWLLTALVNAKTGSIYNIGSEEGIDLQHLATVVSSKLINQPRIEINKYSSLQNDFHWVANTQKIQKDLGVSQKINLEMSINKTIQYYSNLKK